MEIRLTFDPGPFCPSDACVLYMGRLYTNALRTSYTPRFAPGSPREDKGRQGVEIA
jgi:hypothetical protein